MLQNWSAGYEHGAGGEQLHPHSSLFDSAPKKQHGMNLQQPPQPFSIRTCGSWRGLAAAAARPAQQGTAAVAAAAGGTQRRRRPVAPNPICTAAGLQLLLAMRTTSGRG